MAELERPNVRRRSSLGRALERVRDALKRRGSSGTAAATLQSTGEEAAATATTTTPSAVEAPRVAPEGATAASEGLVTGSKAAGPHESTTDSQLVPDDKVDEDEDGNEEPLTSTFSSRTGLNEDIARALFERYGLKYQPRTATGEDRAEASSKIRRVERPVRIRIHWTCHECQRQFGHERACTGCGHRRCEECARAPPKKVKEILDQVKKSQAAGDRTAANKEQILAAISPNTVASPVRPGALPDPTGEDGPLELDPDDERGNVDVSRLTIQQRPRSAFKLAMRSKADGQGETTFEPTMVATVQRVYRKPRQRVRWQCDKCETVFVDGQRCRVCDHLRCGVCVRSPVKHVPPQPDPAVLQSLNDRIDAWQRQRESTVANPLKPDIS